MSQIEDRLGEIDNKKLSLIAQAVKKNHTEIKKVPEPQPEKNPEKKRPSMLIFLTVVFAVVIMFSYLVMRGVNTFTKRHEQIAAIFEQHLEEYKTFEEHLTAMESEFRRAFKRDRDQIKEIAEALKQNYDTLSKTFEELQQQLDDMKVSQKKISGNIEEATESGRKYSALSNQLEQIQGELTVLRAKMTMLTIDDRNDGSWIEN